MKKRKGLSPVIATVLLIVIVVVIALIIFLWFKGIMQEDATKFGKNIELVCGDVDFTASYSVSAGNLQIVNNGNVPIYGMRMKLSEPGSHETIDVSSWPSIGLMSGGTYSEIVNTGNAEEIILIPVLLGSTDGGEQTFICDEQYGFEISLI